MSTDPAALSHLRHELRTPLNHIIGYSEMLLEDAADGRATGLEPGLRTVHENAQRLLALVNDFLGRARVDAGEVDVPRLSAEASTPLDAIVTALEAVKLQVHGAGADGARDDLERIAAAAAALHTMISTGLDPDSPRATPESVPTIAPATPSRSPRKSWAC